MNAKQLIVAVLGFAAVGVALADDAAPLKTRAEVIAEFQQAGAQGTLVPSGDASTYPSVGANAASTRTRAEVRAEALESLKATYRLDPDHYTGA